MRESKILKCPYCGSEDVKLHTNGTLKCGCGEIFQILGNIIKSCSSCDFNSGFNINTCAECEVKANEVNPYPLWKQRRIRYE